MRSFSKTMQTRRGKGLGWGGGGVDVKLYRIMFYVNKDKKDLSCL